MIAGLMKQFGMTKQEILWGESWLNLVLFMAPFAAANRRAGADSEPEPEAISPMEFFKMFGDGSNHKR